MGKYYADHPTILNDYLRIITDKLTSLKEREIIFTYEQETSKTVEKNQFKINLNLIKYFE